jgi:hypothetical protein
MKTYPLLLLSLLPTALFGQSTNLGLFTTSGDIGNPAIKGSAEYNAATGEYKITGAGANMWDSKDELHYVWREMSGNFTVSATVRFLGQGADHRKAGIIVRQSLDPDTTYADVVMHGNGMPGLQWRSKPAEETNTFDPPFDGPGTFQIRLVRTGVRIFMYMAKPGAELKEIAHTEVTFRGPVLVGLGVCSHEAGASTTAVFSNVTVESQPAPAPAAKK